MQSKTRTAKRQKPGSSAWRSHGGERKPRLIRSPTLPKAPPESEAADPVGTQSGDQLHSTNAVDSSTHFARVRQVKKFKIAKERSFAQESVKFREWGKNCLHEWCRTRGTVTRQIAHQGELRYTQ